MDIWARECQTEGVAGAKISQESSWHVIGTARRPVWLELSGQGRSRRSER